MIDPDASTPEPASEPNPLTPPLPSGTGLQRNVAAALACLFSLVGGVVFLILEKRDPFVRFYAMQSVFLGGAMFAFFFVMTIFVFILAFIPLIGWLLIPLVFLLKAAVGLAFLVVWIVTVVKALSNTEWSIPFLGPLARKQLETSTPSAF